MEVIDPASEQAKPLIAAIQPEKVVPGNTYGATFRKLDNAYRLSGWVVLVAEYDGLEALYGLLRPAGDTYQFVTSIPVVGATDEDQLAFLHEKAPDAPEAVLQCLLTHRA